MVGETTVQPPAEHLLVASGTTFFAPARRFVDGGPGMPFGFFRRHAFVFITFLNVFSLPFLFVGVGRFIATCHSQCFKGESDARRKRQLGRRTWGVKLCLSGRDKVR